MCSWLGIGTNLGLDTPRVSTYPWSRRAVLYPGYLELSPPGTAEKGPRGPKEGLMKLLILTCLLALSLSASGLPLTDLPDFADLPVPWSDPSFPSNAYSIAIGNAPQDDVFENSADTLIGYWNP